jgi:hypothetical protein
MDLATNLHRVWSSGLPLCVMCRQCLHRALVPHDAIGARRGNMDLVKDIRFVCSQCGARDIEFKLAARSADLKRFMDEYRR